MPGAVTRSPCGSARSGRGRPGPTGRRGWNCRPSPARTTRKRRCKPCSKDSPAARSRCANCRSCLGASSGRCALSTALRSCASANAPGGRSEGNSTRACCPSPRPSPTRWWRRCARRARRCPRIWRAQTPYPGPPPRQRACILLLIRTRRVRPRLRRKLHPRPPRRQRTCIRLLIRARPPTNPPAPQRTKRPAMACIFLLIRAANPCPRPRTRHRPRPLPAGCHAHFKVMPPSTTSSRPVT